MRVVKRFNKIKSNYLKISTFFTLRFGWLLRRRRFEAQVWSIWLLSWFDAISNWWSFIDFFFSPNLVFFSVFFFNLRSRQLLILLSIHRHSKNSTFYVSNAFVVRLTETMKSTRKSNDGRNGGFKCTYVNLCAQWNLLSENKVRFIALKKIQLSITNWIVNNI